MDLMMKNNYYGVGIRGLKSKNMLLDQTVEHNECHMYEKNLRDREICVCRCRTYHIQEGNRRGIFFFFLSKKKSTKKSHTLIPNLNKIHY